MTVVQASKEDRPIKVVVSGKPLNGREFDTYTDAHAYAVKRCRKTGKPVYLTGVYVEGSVMIVTTKPNKG